MQRGAGNTMEEKTFGTVYVLNVSSLLPLIKLLH